MKIITIGRSDECDIVVDDKQDLISRKHALLRLFPFGKMELVSIGKNGTYVNGMPIKNDKIVKVSRKDVISFAHVKSLDWSLVKDPYKIYYYIAYSFAVLLVALMTVLYIPSFTNPDKPAITHVESAPANQNTVVADTTKKEPAKPELNDTTNKDSLMQAFDKKKQEEEAKKKEAEAKKKEAEAKKKEAETKNSKSKNKNKKEDGKNSSAKKQVF